MHIGVVDEFSEVFNTEGLAIDDVQGVKQQGVYPYYLHEIIHY